MINNRQQSGRRRGRGGQGGQRQNNNGGGRGPESGNRIDNRARGNAAQLLEKYKTLARDAQQSGDRVLTEYYLQFADHYFRVLSETRARYEEAQASRRQQGDYSGEDQPFDAQSSEDAVEEEDDFGFRQPVRAPQPAPQQQRDARPRDDRPREDRSRDDRPRESQSRDYAPRDNQPRDYQARDNQPRDDRPRYDRPRDDSSRDDRPRRDYGEDRGNRSAQPHVAPAEGAQADVPASEATTERRPPRRQPRAAPVRNGADHDDGEARLDIGILPPALNIPVAEPQLGLEGEPVAVPKRRGRPRKDASAAAIES